MERLTKLQRLGISFLLFQYAKHDSRLIRNGGIITFKRSGGITVMIVSVDGVKKDLLSLVLEESEDINDKVQYRYVWDNYNQMFTIEERGYLS